MSRPTDGRETRVCVAQIGAAHGLRGGVHLRSFTEHPAAFAQYGALETEDGSRKLEIESVRPSKDGFTVRFIGVTKREAAETLRSAKLYVDRARLPAPEKNEFYHADLIGLEALTPSGEALGEVVAVHNFGAGDILELRLASGAAAMFAFDEKTVPQVDVAARRLVIVPPVETIADSNAEASPEAT